MLERCAGLVFGFLFRDGRASRLHDEVLAAGLAQGYDWFWLHLSLADHRARRFLESFDEMVPDARELLLGTEDRIQIHLTPGGGWGILPDLERDFDDEAVGSGRLGFWLDGNRLITARRHPLRASNMLRDAVEMGQLPRDSAQALAQHQEIFIGLLEKRLGHLSRELARIEDAVLADRGDGAALGPLRRELSRYGREFSSLRSAIHRATGARNVVAASPLLEHLPLLQQESEDFERDAGALSDRARLLYEEIETRIASTTNRSLSALTVISTLLLPPTFLVGAFGMNLEGIPWARHHSGFAIVFSLCLLLIAGGYAVLRRFRILP
jgi:zinc transporter